MHTVGLRERERRGTSRNPTKDFKKLGHKNAKKKKNRGPPCR
jgi:hypothetical protein